MIKERTTSENFPIARATVAFAVLYLVYLLCAYLLQWFELVTPRSYPPSMASWFAAIIVFFGFYNRNPRVNLTLRDVFVFPLLVLTVDAIFTIALVMSSSPTFSSDLPVQIVRLLVSGAGLMFLIWAVYYAVKIRRDSET